MRGPRNVSPSREALRSSWRSVPLAYAKVAANVRAKPSGLLTRVTTETRIQATDSVAKRKFALYWGIDPAG
jgi:hypothetical protein